MRQTLLSPALRHCNKCGIFRSALIVVTPHRRSGRMHATRLHDSSTNGCGYEQSELRSGHRHLRFQNGDLALPFRDHQSNRAPADFPQKAPFLHYVGRQSRLEPPRSMQPLMYDQPQPPHKGRRRQAQPRRSPLLARRSSPEAVCLDWARTFSESSRASAIALNSLSRPALTGRWA